MLALSPPLLPLLVLALCEATKVGIEWMKTGQWHRRLFHPGGMPSSHSAFVTSLVIVVAKLTGVHSAEFAIALCFAIYVYYDAFGPRHELGHQAHLLNELQHKEHLQEMWGHTLKQVIGGILFGTVVTMWGLTNFQFSISSFQ